MKRLAFIFTILLLALSVNAQANYPKHEVRAVWLTTIGGLDWPHSYANGGMSAENQKDELRRILDQLQKANVNTVLLQTRVRATTIYPSSFEPWDGCLSGHPGQSPGYDALAFAVDECHKRGMELHAWVVTIPVGKWNALGCTRLRQRYPKLILKIGQEGYMNPESEQTGDYLASMCREIAHNYDVDGIHLDYIRYPETWNRKKNVYTGRQYITSIVRKINQSVKSEKPWIKLSCSPVGKYDDLTRYWSHGWNANTKVCQDAQGWLRDGLMDELFPMMYFKGDQFFPFAIDWAECSYGRIVAPGLGIYMLHPKELNWSLDIVKRELNVLREYGMGHCYFRSKFFTDNTKGIYNFVAHHFDRYPALVPPMTWARVATPSSPTNRRVGKERISWTAARNNSRAPYLLYNIYASSQWPVDINDARNLVKARWQKTSAAINKDLYYAVTTVDRYGNESEPLQMAKSAIVQSAQWLKNDGKVLLLPEKSPMLDAQYIVIETMTGSIIATRPYQGTRIDIRRIPNGVYTVRTINRKNVTHRLGQFIVKR